MNLNKELPQTPGFYYRPHWGKNEICDWFVRLNDGGFCLIKKVVPSDTYLLFHSDYPYNNYEFEFESFTGCLIYLKTVDDILC